MSLLQLPPDVLCVLLQHIVAVANPAQILQLAACCHGSLALVEASGFFWQQQAQRTGWLRPGLQHPVFVPQPQQQQKQQQQQQPECDTAWCHYYRVRMNSRWRLRALMRKYTPFLTMRSRLALQPGASVQQLEQAEGRLGLRLPWELWELLRYRAGQLPSPGVMFADSCRLLGVDELAVVQLEQPALPSLAPAVADVRQAQLAALQAQLPALSVGNGSGGSSAAGGRDGVVFLSNAAGSISYACCCGSGAVHIVRGFTQRRVAGSMAGFLQRLLT